MCAPTSAQAGIQADLANLVDGQSDDGTTNRAPLGFSFSKGTPHYTVTLQHGIAEVSMRTLRNLTFVLRLAAPVSAQRGEFAGLSRHLWVMAASMSNCWRDNAFAPIGLPLPSPSTQP